MKVVSSYQVYDNSRGALKLLEIVGYTYKNARVNKEGKGFLGFSQITITDNIGQQIINTYYNILSTLYVPVLYSTFTSVSGQGNIGSAQSSYNYYRFAEPLISTNKLYFIYPSLVYTYDYLNDQSNNVSNTFTASDFYHGNPSKERLTQYNNSTAYSGGTAGYVEASNQFEDYTLNGYTFKRLKSSSVISNRTGDASNARTDISLGYDAAKPPIMKNKTVSYFNYGGSATGGSVVYSYNRDNYGNISSQHVTGSGKTRYTAYIYTNGRFLNRVSNALGHAVLYTYNSKTCLLEVPVMPIR
jgi:YD repeat-containing protein